MFNIIYVLLLFLLLLVIVINGYMNNNNRIHYKKILTSSSINDLDSNSYDSRFCSIKSSLNLYAKKKVKRSI